MFDASVYAERRRRLAGDVGSGLILLLGNGEPPMNYPANAYPFRQDSSFLYFFGVDVPDMAGLIDAESGAATVYGDDFTVDDIVWRGAQPTVADLAAPAGITSTQPRSKLAETLGALARDGVRPKRTILFASWDAEEFTLTSSTEWGEQFAHGLGRGAVAYLNVDSAASGTHFSASAVPALNRLIEEATRSVRDPDQRIPVAAAWRARTTTERGSLPTGAGAALVNNRLGSGSDYAVFLNYLGVPIADFTFDGPYGVYHSIYDNHHWVSRIGDPGFRYHVALVHVWGLMALRLAYF